MSGFPPSGSGSPANDPIHKNDFVGANSGQFSNLNEAADRPTGLTALIGLHALFALGTITGSMLFLLIMRITSETIQPDPSDYWMLLFLAEMVLVGIVSMASVVGLRMRAQSGWWLSVFLYVQMGTFAMVLLLIGIWDDLQPAREPGILPILSGCCFFIAPVSTLILFYLFQIDILRFFKLQELNRTRALVRLLAIGLAIAFSAILGGRFIP